MNWTAAEDAIHAWLVAATGVPAARALWRDQAFAEPASPYLTLKIIGVTSIGHDGLEHSVIPDGEPGADLLTKTEGRRDVSVSVQAYSDALTGAGSALSLLSAAQDALGLPGVRARLRAGGVSPFNAGAITDLSAVRETRVQSRAVMTTQFHAVASTSERGTYIASAPVAREV